MATLTNRRIAKKCSGGCQTRPNRVGPKALARTQRSFYLYLFFSVGLSNRHVSTNTRETLLINSSAGICPLEKKPSLLSEKYLIQFWIQNLLHEKLISGTWKWFPLRFYSVITQLKSVPAPHRVIW